MKPLLRIFHQRQLVRYVFIGGVAYVVEMLALLLLKKSVDYSPGILVGMSFWIGLITSFALQKYITFKNHDNSKKVIGTQALFYGTLVLVNYAFTIVFVETFTGYVGIVVARTIALIITTGWNFIVYKRLIFRHDT